MEYKTLVSFYEKLESTTKRLEKTFIISELLDKTSKDDLTAVIYLIQGEVFPSWSEEKTGVSSRLIIKAIAAASGMSPGKIEKDWAKIGDLGEVASNLIKTKHQKTLFSKKLTVKKVFENIRKLSTLVGQGTVSKKIALVAELLTSSSSEEAKFITRTVLNQLRIGVAAGTLRDAIVWAYFPKVIGINDQKYKHNKKVLEIKDFEGINKKDLKKYDFIQAENEKLARKIYNYLSEKVQYLYDLSNDFATVSHEIREKGLKVALKETNMKPGTPINAMLASKTPSFKTAFEALGKPAQAEYKLDGFRVQFHKDGDQVWLFTRRLENVTKQFKELIPIVKKHVKAKSFIIDTEVVGIDPKTKKYLPFQYISQRIRRKYHLEKTAKAIPVEIDVFDIIYKDGEALINKTQKERRKILEKTIKQKPKEIVITKKLVTSSEEEMEKFYKESLNKGNEGIMVKNLDKDYISGRRVGGWLKIKPGSEPLDLIITGAEWGEGKRAKWLSSFTLSCKSKGKYLMVGKVGTGIKEKSEGVTFAQLTKELKPLIKETKGKHVKIKPKLIAQVEYEEIQRSPNYDSGYALRFPRITVLRPDLGINSNDVATLSRLEKIYKQQKK